VASCPLAALAPRRSLRLLDLCSGLDWLTVVPKSKSDSDGKNNPKAAEIQLAAHFMFSCTIIVMSCVSLFPIKKDGIIWATFVLTARPPCGRRGQAVTNSRNCLISQFLSETQRKVVFHGQLFLLQVQLAIRMSKRAFQRSKDVQRCPKPSSLTIFFQVSCGQAPAKQVAQSKNIYTAQTTCTGSHKRIQQSNRNGLKKTTVNPHGPIVASSINRRGLPLATNESSS